jgi:rare lipoprotein A
MKRISVVLAAGLCVAALCAAQNSPAVDFSNFRQEGIASWYGTEFDGRPTASGEVFNASLYTAAHPTLPFGTQLTVTNLNNGRKVNVRVNDRGPFVSSRIIDLSQAAAQMLDMLSAGTAPVLVETLGAASYGQGDNVYQAEANTHALSQGGYSNATSQIVAPSYPAYQAPVYQAPPPQSPDPVVIQVQPPQHQQITQYFQQPPAPQNPAPPPRPQQVQELPPVRQIQPIQQVLPVQQVQQQPVIQPVQPIIQPVIIPQPVQPAPPEGAQAPQNPAPQAQVPVQPGAPPAQPVPRQVQPLHIQIPIEVQPVLSAEPVTGPAARPVEQPPDPAPAAPASPPPVAAPIPVAPAPATVPAVVKPGRIYRVQVGSYREARNALATFERLKGAGLNPVYERNGEYFRVVLSGIPSEEIGGVLQKINASGFRDPLLREER